MHLLSEAKIVVVLLEITMVRWNSRGSQYKIYNKVLIGGCNAYAVSNIQNITPGSCRL